MHLSNTKNGFHIGEERLHTLLHFHPPANPTSPYLSPHAARLLKYSSPLLAVGVLDDEEDGWPWCTVLCAYPRTELPQKKEGVVEALGGSMIGVSACVTSLGTTNEDSKPAQLADPVLHILRSRFADSGDGSSGTKPTGSDTIVEKSLIGALGIHLERRDRVKVSGRIMGGGMVEVKGQSDRRAESWLEMRMGIQVTSSLGKCGQIDYLSQPTKEEFPHLMTFSLTLYVQETARNISTRSRLPLTFLSQSSNTAHLRSPKRPLI